jgi:hypothetical protein
MSKVRAKDEVILAQVDLCLARYKKEDGLSLKNADRMD